MDTSSSLTFPLPSLTDPAEIKILATIAESGLLSRAVARAVQHTLAELSYLQSSQRKLMHLMGQVLCSGQLNFSPEEIADYARDYIDATEGVPRGFVVEETEGGGMVVRFI